MTENNGNDLEFLKISLIFNVMAMLVFMIGLIHNYHTDFSYQWGTIFFGGMIFAFSEGMYNLSQIHHIKNNKRQLQKGGKTYIETAKLTEGL